MEKTILCAKIFDLFAVEAEYPWQKQPSFAVFRHILQNVQNESDGF